MTIEDMWKEHREAVFPSVSRGRDVDGIDLVMLDADIAGCVLAVYQPTCSIDSLTFGEQRF
jgi:hypothetical protein